jgi:hypothetical protein
MPRLLMELEKEDTPYAVAVTAFWLIELVYCVSFMSCLEEDAKTPFELMSTVKRWGSPEFHQYTISLKKLADKALENASEAEQKQAQEVSKAACFILDLKSSLVAFRVAFRYPVAFWLKHHNLKRL